MVRAPEYPPTLPEGLPRECWDTVTRELVANNLWDTDCRDAVEAYCIVRAHFLQADARVRELGFVAKSKRGKPMNTPWVGIANAYFDRMVRLASELGLTPVARGRVTKAKRVSSVPAAKFLQGA
jgi:P27 family predicted phage terminase small subunit